MRRLIGTGVVLVWAISVSGTRARAAQYQTGAPLTTPVVTENIVKRALKEGKVVYGPGVYAASPDVAATLAGIGFDFIWIEMEHGPLTLETARSMILATRGLKAMPFTRVPVNEPWQAKRALDIGSLGVIFPFVSTREAAERAVRACHYPPAGTRGYGPTLAAPRWGLNTSDYVKFVEAQVMVIVIIEQQEAIEHIEEIAAVPGIDVLFLGANDLSFSLGVGGRLDDPLVEQVAARLLAAGRKHNVAVGYPASAPAEIQKRVAQGFRFFLTTNDIGLLSAGARDLLSKVPRSDADKPGSPVK
jgi:2-keto-3-deoxy-L-rhamnonate aldolase RhmA